MKKRKFLPLCATLLAAGLACTAFVGCSSDGTEDSVPEGMTSYVYEAEDVDLFGLSGPVFSGEASDYKMVLGENTSYIKNDKKVMDSISGGYFVSYFNGPGTILSFEFNSNKAATGNTLKVRMASEWGTLNIKPTNIIIRINGEQVDYEPFNVSGVKLSNDGSVSKYQTPFKDFTITENFSILEGANTIEIEVGEARDYGLEGFVKYCPGIDCIKMVTDSSVTLTWDKLFEQNKSGIVQS